MKFYDNLIGDDNHSVILEFIGTDNLETFNKNKINKPSDWIYHNKQISYEHNENGHRCKPVNHINLNNYILFAGCSHTYGTGLPLEETYSYKLASKLGVDYYNLSVNGSDNYSIFHNLYYWNLKKPKPKLVIAQWTDPSRFCVVQDQIIQQFGVNNIEENVTQFIEYADMSGYMNLKMYLFSKLIETTFKIPIIHVGFFGQMINNPDNIILIDCLDKARDEGNGSANRHNGIKTQDFIVDKITTYYHSIR